MYNITDVQSLGTDYTVADRNGNIIKTIQVIPHTEILEASIGEYALHEDKSISEYLEKSIENLSGFDDIDPNKVLWYSSYDADVVLSQIIEYAVKHGYDKIILEHLEELDD